MLEGIEILCHSSIRIEKSKIIYIDPFRIKKDYKDADYIFITHGHYDHFSIEDINKVRKESSMIIVPEDLYEKAVEIGFEQDHIITVIPNGEYCTNNLTFNTVSAYNIDKTFHPKENKWVGYILHIDNTSYYIAGDTDLTEDNMKMKCDVALVPVGGTYTMTYKEAAELVNSIKPKIAIPTHYGEIVGSKEDGEKFINLLNDKITGKVLIRQ